MDFNKAFDKLMDHEGGYSNHPSDPGGETMYGITKRVARKHGYAGNMKDLPRLKARDIARVEYWNDCRADDVPDVVRFDLFDTCYHSGASQAIKLLQRAAGTVDDGAFGPLTKQRVDSMDPYKLLSRFNGFRLLFLSDLKNWDDFSEGWAKRIARNLIAAGD